MLRIVALSVLMGCSSYPLAFLAAQAKPAAPAPTGYRARALAILKTVPLIDGHNDIPSQIHDRGGIDSIDFLVNQPKLMTDIPRLRAGGVGAQFWSAYVPSSTMHQGMHPAVYALEQIDRVYQLCNRYSKDLAMAYTAADIERNFKAGKISCLIGIEGGHAIESSLGTLRTFYRLGARYMTLTHWETTDWADAATDSAKHGGLTPFGEQVVLEMNRLGMLVDLSHVSDATMMSALRVSKAPVFYSHSSARALDGHVRNVPDSILKLVAANGGVVMVNFAPDFVSEERRLYVNAHQAEYDSLKKAGMDSTALADSAKAWQDAAPKATLQQVADHIQHIRDVAGIDHVGLGSDFDGIDSAPVGLEDVSKYPDLLGELLRRGWGDADVKKVAGLNALRVLRAVESVAAQTK